MDEACWCLWQVEQCLNLRKRRCPLEGRGQSFVERYSVRRGEAQQATLLETKTAVVRLEVQLLK
jgi:hypothetical protein